MVKKIILFLLVVASYSCDDSRKCNDVKTILDFYRQNNRIGKIENLNQQTILLDEEKNKIETYNYDETGILESYTFFNSLNQLNKFDVLFDKYCEVIEIKGGPFYIENSAYELDTLYSDTLKVFINAAKIYGFETQVRIFHNEEGNDKLSLIGMKKMIDNSFLLLNPEVQSGFNQYLIECNISKEGSSLVKDTIEFDFFHPAGTPAGATSR
jgi:hypothetical protein